jgi:hypothetical protein
MISSSGCQLRVAAVAAALVVAVVVVAAAAAAEGPPNIVFLHCESTDGRLYAEDSPVPIPNIRKLQARGAGLQCVMLCVMVCDGVV